MRTYSSKRCTQSIVTPKSFLVEISVLVAVPAYFMSRVILWRNTEQIEILLLRCEAIESIKIQELYSTFQSWAQRPPNTNRWCPKSQRKIYHRNWYPQCPEPWFPLTSPSVIWSLPGSQLQLLKPWKCRMVSHTHRAVYEPNDDFDEFFESQRNFFLKLYCTSANTM